MHGACLLQVVEDCHRAILVEFVGLGKLCRYVRWRVSLIDGYRHVGRVHLDRGLEQLLLLCAQQ